MLIFKRSFILNSDSCCHEHFAQLHIIMASLESKIFGFLLRFINKKKFLELQFSFGKFDFNNCAIPPKEIYKKCIVEIITFNGRNVITLSPKSGKRGKHILYFHGGAYVQNFVRQHWIFMSTLVRKTNCTIIAPDYPLAPANTYIDSFAMLLPLYLQTLKSAGNDGLIIMGDSAGGGLALALAQKLHIENIEQPEQLILLSPWLDITMSNPAIISIDADDPFLGIEGLKKAGKAYAGNSKRDHFLLSPVYGSLEGLPKISLFTGSKDILVADARKLYSLAQSKGVQLNYREYNDMLHVWMLMNFPESKRATVEIIQLIRN